MKTHGFAINFCYAYLKELESVDLLDTAQVPSAICSLILLSERMKRE